MQFQLFGNTKEVGYTRSLCYQPSSPTRPLLTNLQTNASSSGLHCNNCTSSVIEPSKPQLDKMPSSSNVKPSSHAERQTTSDDSSAPSTQRDGRRGDHSSRQQHSRKPSASAINDRRTASSSQRTNRGVGVDERRTERVQITTRETVTSRTRSPERRSEPLPVQQPERPKASEATRAYPGVPRPQATKADVPQRKPIHSQTPDV